MPPPARVSERPFGIERGRLSLQGVGVTLGASPGGDNTSRWSSQPCSSSLSSVGIMTAAAQQAHWGGRITKAVMGISPSILFSTMVIVWTAAPAHAQWVATPFLGMNLAGDAEFRRGGPGGSVGY